MSDKKKPSLGIPRLFGRLRAEGAAGRAEDYVARLVLDSKKAAAVFQATCSKVGEAAALLEEAREAARRAPPEAAKELLERIEKAEGRLNDELPFVCGLVRVQTPKPKRT